MRGGRKRRRRARFARSLMAHVFAVFVIVCAELNAKFKAIKEGRSLDVKPCKWGPTCKYRSSTCRREHGPDPNAEQYEKKTQVLSMATVVPLSEADIKAVSSHHMQDAVSAGLRTSKKRSRRADNDESKEQNSDDQSDDDEQDAYSSSSSSDDEDAPASKRPHNDDGSASASSAAAPASSSSAAAAAAASSSSAAAAASSSSSSAYASVYIAPTPSFPTITNRPAELESIDAKQAQMGMAGVLAKMKSKQQNHKSESAPAAAAASSSSSPSSSAAAATAASFDPIDLSAYATSSDLMSFGVAHLTHELTRVGLKSGGTHEQKAQRLFMLKGTTIEKLPPKLRAAA